MAARACVRTEELADDGGGALERDDVLGRRPRRHLCSYSSRRLSPAACAGAACEELALGNGRRWEGNGQIVPGRRLRLYGGIGNSVLFEVDQSMRTMVGFKVDRAAALPTVVCGWATAPG